MSSNARVTTHQPARRLGKALSSETSMALAHLVEMAQRQLTEKRLCLVQTREQLQHLDTQIAEFLADKSVPQRNAGLFLCRMAVHLRGIANEMDGRVE